LTANDKFSSGRPPTVSPCFGGQNTGQIGQSRRMLGLSVMEPGSSKTKTPVKLLPKAAAVAKTTTAAAHLIARREFALADRDGDGLTRSASASELAPSEAAEAFPPSSDGLRRFMGIDFSIVRFPVNANVGLSLAAYASSNA
jgi:hypothetical protein